MTLQEVIDHFMWGWSRNVRKGEELSPVKVGTREKVLDVIARNCDLSQKQQYVSWKE
jgi:hypothetical protein